jgi:phosphoserine phosphatase
MAVFDCDGTMIHGDIGEAMFYRQIEQWFFKVSPATVWTDHPQRRTLDEQYRILNPLPHRQRIMAPEFEQFAGILLSWYFDQIAGGAVIKACTDIVKLLTGFTLAEVREFANETFEEEKSAPLSERRLGGKRLPRGIRFLAESVDLLTTLRDRGFDIWAVSGSSVWSIEPVFRELQIPMDRLIGLEIRVCDGVLESEGVEPVPIQQGKIPALQLRTPTVPVLAASDSRNDIPLLLYAADLRVRINSRRRDTAEFFHAVGAPADGHWINIETPTILA